MRLSSGLTSYAIIVLSFLIFLLWRLGSLVPGLSQAEAASRSSSNDLSGLLTNPADAPYHLIQRLFSIIHPGFFSLRLASFFLAIIIALAFYAYVKNLFGRVIGLFGALILISLPFYAIAARQATPQIMLFMPAALIYAYAHLSKARKKKTAWLALVLVAGISLYTPGMIWWVIGGALASHKKIAAFLASLPSAAAGLGIGLFCLVITPLIVVCGLHLASLKTVLAIPASMPRPEHFGAELVRMFGSLIVKSPGGNNLLLANLPILNITVLALVVFGSYALFTAARGKAIAFGSNILLAVILAALNSNVAYLALAVPVLIITATAGLRYLYVEWRGIFPRNPVPKTFALVLIAAVVLSQLYYTANYSLRAWPRSPSIQQAFVLK